MTKKLNKEILDFIKIKKSPNTNFILSNGQRIEVFKELPTGNKTNPARVADKSGIIGVGLKSFNKFTPEIQYFLIIWAMNRHRELHDRAADSIATKEYLKMGYSKRKLALGFLQLIKHNAVCKKLT